MQRRTGARAPISKDRFRERGFFGTALPRIPFGASRLRAFVIFVRTKLLRQPREKVDAGSSPA